MNYSSIQYFFWLISGSEISALKKCPNDYNRHANIGFMIFMTAFFASITGFIAAITFVKVDWTLSFWVNSKLWGVLVFALVWATLIFALDRSMVNSIKKDPTATSEESFSKYFRPRLALAIVLSFFMSIPLDHIIFEKQIKVQMEKNKQQAVLETINEQTKARNIKGDSSIVASKEKDINTIDATLANGCNTEDCKKYRSEKQRLELNKNSVQKKINDLSVDIKRLQREEYPNRNLFEDKNADKNKLINERRSLSTQIATASKSLEQAINEWQRPLKTQKKIASKAKNTAENSRISNRQAIDKFAEELEKVEKESDGFDKQFTTLFMMPDFGIQFLKWLLFIGLLVIEILPTYLKLKTPIGDYEWEIYYREQSHVNDIKTRLETDQKILDANEKTRMAKEIELNDKILEKVASIELELANNALDKWEKEVKSKTYSSQNKA